MEIKIHNPNGLPVIDYRKVKPLQGNLKDLKEKNYNKLKSVLLKRGFTVPLFVWREQTNIDGAIVQHYWLLDGHGRQRVMTKEDMQPYEVPYILIEADNHKDAKAQLLEITSQYQTITQEGFDEFTDELSDEDFEDVAFDALAFVGQGGGKEVSFTTKPHNDIVITFESRAELESCLAEIQEICEKYETAQVRVDDGQE